MCRDWFWTSRCTAVSRYASRPWVISDIPANTKRAYSEGKGNLCHVCDLFQHAAVIVDQYNSWRSVIHKQNSERQIKYSCMPSSCPDITNVMFWSFRRIYNCHTVWITTPLAALWNKEIKITAKHHLPVAPHKECQVCSQFRNVGNNPTFVPRTLGTSIRRGTAYQTAESRKSLQICLPIIRFTQVKK